MKYVLLDVDYHRQENQIIGTGEMPYSEIRLFIQDLKSGPTGETPLFGSNRSETYCYTESLIVFDEEKEGAAELTAYIYFERIKERGEI